MTVNRVKPEQATGKSAAAPTSPARPLAATQLPAWSGALGPSQPAQDVRFMLFPGAGAFRW